MHFQPVQPGSPLDVVCSVAPSRGGQSHNAIAWPGAGHVSVQIRQRPAPDSELDVTAFEDTLKNLDRYNLNLLSVAQPGLILIAWIAQTGPTTHTRRHKAGGSR